ncbi:MAG: ThuA domain-containing protein [Bacteroidales bacterium]
MKLVYLSLALYLLPVLNPAFGQKYDNLSRDLKGKSILLFCKNGEGYVHDNIPSAKLAFLKMAGQEGFKLDTTDDAAVFSEERLKSYHAVVFCNTNNDVFETEAQKVAFMRYIQAGGGFVGIHSACGTERNWAWFKQMLGGTFLVHPPFQKFPVRVLDPEHPSVKGIPDPWIVKDELYFLKELNPTIRIIMASDFSAIKDGKDLPNTFGTLFPSVWCNTFDGGRQWYTALGHDKSDYSNPLYIQHLLGGLKWSVAEKLDYSKAHSTSSTF